MGIMSPFYLTGLAGLKGCTRSDTLVTLWEVRCVVE